MAGPPDEFVTFFKAMADASRLQIIGLLAKEPMSVEQLAARLEISPSTASHHLSKLSQVGLVSARAKSYYNFYQFEAGALQKMVRRLHEDEIRSFAPASVLSEDEKILRNFLEPDGRIRKIPIGRKRKLVVLTHILQVFERRRRYPEKELNSIIARFHEDTASIRRDMIGFQMMARERGVYWRTDPE
jgi:biotin operon repressor